MDIITSITRRIKYLSLILSCCKWINLHLPCSASTLLGLPLQRWGDCTSNLWTLHTGLVERLPFLVQAASEFFWAKLFLHPLLNQPSVRKKERNSRSAKRIAIITEGTTFKSEVKHLRGLKARNVFQGCARVGFKLNSSISTCFSRFCETQPINQTIN